MLVTSLSQSFDTSITDIAAGQVFAVIDVGGKSVGHYIVNRLGMQDERMFQKIYSNKTHMPVTNLETGRIVFKPKTLKVQKLNVQMVTSGD